MSNLELEVGGVYQAEDKGQGIFIGYVNTTIFESTNKSASKSDFVFTHKPIENGMLFYEIFKFETIEKSMKDMIEKNNHLQYKVLIEHPYIEKVSQVKLPSGLIEGLRSKGLKVVKNNILEFTGHIEKNDYVYMDSWDLAEQIVHDSEFLNIYSTDSAPVVPFDVRKFLLFS